MTKQFSCLDGNVIEVHKVIDKNGNEVKNKPICCLVGKDGNAFAIMGEVSKTLRKAGLGDKVAEYKAKAMSGDYDNLLRVSMEYVEIV